ncbi:MAG: VTT domain-containing protein [Nanoarchaeota archaeon]|nr:VTT domain-containing protein [Nanoarchaeota archaeon]
MDAGFFLWFGTFAQSLIGTYGYVGLFAVNLIGSATIILPLLPGFLFVFAFGATLDPWLIALSAGAGAALGELTGYAVGKGGGAVLEWKHNSWLKRAEKWSNSHGIFPVIFIFAATPLPADVIGILAGVIDYDVKRFLLASFLGKFVQFAILAWAGFYSLSWILPYFGF